MYSCMLQEREDDYDYIKDILWLGRKEDDSSEKDKCL